MPNLAEKRVDFELIKGKKGKGNTIQTPDGDYDPSDFSTIGRGVGKCPNCESILEDTVIKKYSTQHDLGSQLYAVAFKQGKGRLEFRLPNELDLEGFEKAAQELEKIKNNFDLAALIPSEGTSVGLNDSIRNYEYGLRKYEDCFNSRQLLTLVTYVEIINEAKEKIRAELGEEKLQAIATYLALVLDRCVDKNCRLSGWVHQRTLIPRASASHSLNLMWNYGESVGSGKLWLDCYKVDLLGNKG